jgi:hypothetical protein
MQVNFFIFRTVTSRPAGKYEAAFQEAFERKLSERSVRLDAACQKYGDLLHWQAGGTCHTTKSICRVQSCVWRLPKNLPPTPLSTQRVCPPPAPGGERGGASIF